jgi:tyrosine aminotransferase
VWRTQASAGARNSRNPIADLLGRIKMAPPHPDRQLISLAMGDPTACRNLGPPLAAVAALQEALASGNFNGYGPSHGDVAARAAVAK